MKKLLTLLIFCLSMAHSATAQVFVPLNRLHSQAFDSWLVQYSNVAGSCIQPFSFQQYSTIVNVDSILAYNVHKPPGDIGWIARKWGYESLLNVDSEAFKIFIDPLFDFGYGNDRHVNEKYYTNTRGIGIWGQISKEVFFESSFYETQARFPGFLTDYISLTQAAPGSGQARKFGRGGFDYSLSSGSLSFAISHHLMVMAGQGKYFVGNGYRSIFISDNSFNYPFLRIDYQNGNFCYSHVYAVFMGDTMPTDNFGVREKRIGGLSAMSYRFGRWLELSLFEGLVWRSPNDVVNRKLDYNYFNPVIFVNSLLPGLNNKSVTGIGFQSVVLRNMPVYGQFAVNDPVQPARKSTKGWAYQLGLKYFVNWGAHALVLQAELNKCASNMYDNSDSLLFYTHYNQSLAHPLGQNYLEYLTFLTYTYKRLQLSCNIQRAQYGNAHFNTVGNAASDTYNMLFKPPFVSNTAVTNLRTYHLSFSYVANAKTNRRFEVGYSSRNAVSVKGNIVNAMFYVGFKTALNNFYHDL